MNERIRELLSQVKHARKMLGAHSRYGFVEYGDDTDHPARVEMYRRALEEKQS